MKTIKVVVEVELTGTAPDAHDFAQWVETKWPKREEAWFRKSRRAVVTVLSEDRVG